MGWVGTTVKAQAGIVVGFLGEAEGLWSLLDILFLLYVYILKTLFCLRILPARNISK